MSDDEAPSASASVAMRSSRDRGAARTARVEVVVAPGLAAELAAADCFELGARGLEETSDPSGDVRLRVWIDADRADAFAVALRVQLAARAAPGAARSARSSAPPRAHVMPPVLEPDVDWSLRWRDGLGPIVIDERLVVRPPFAPFEPAPGQAVVVIEPGQAFGTGGHASTRLALSHVAALAPSLGSQTRANAGARARVDPAASSPALVSAGARARVDSVASSPALVTGRAPRVLDVGTGSGVLAIAALALAPRGCIAVGFDLDPLAAPAARSNAAANGLATSLRVFTGPIGALSRSAAFDLVLANLLKRELLPIASQVARCVAPTGALVVSGLLACDLAEIASALAPHGLVRASCREEDDLDGERWVSPCFTRR